MFSLCPSNVVILVSGLKVMPREARQKTFVMREEISKRLNY
jgi:hypothetical protein